ncbi:tetratricopeptide repeat protein [Maribrevibacterium harenarium]|uniref:Tetratricopeptide repeat protein n=1 Tax=Maribrevibacterium harenarium TaxID=2589817 RepID=A0A501X2Q5_9GAMM|nr:tetratricopeptide repeat protein [Maribrevibacterium harenarium]TPE54771.1 tetratricopeptide repeat protein [Maribrevibacterium harenarium]
MLRTCGMILLAIPLAVALGCAQNPTTTRSKPIAQPSPTLNDSAFSRILVAEFTLQRHGPKAALPLYLAEAKRQSQLDIIKKTVQLALISQSNNALDESLSLWREVAPDDEHPYALGFSLALDNGDITQGAQLIQQAQNAGVAPYFVIQYLDQNLRSEQKVADVSALLQQWQEDESLVKQLLSNRLDFIHGDYTRVVTQLPTLLQQVPDAQREQLYILLSSSYTELGDLQQSRNTLIKALEVFPSSQRLRINLLGLELKMGRVDQAIADFHAASMPLFLRQQVGLNFAQQLSENHPEKALMLLEEIPKAGGLDYQLDYLKAQIHHQTGDLAAAITLIKGVYGNLAWNATRDLATWLYQANQPERINTLVIERAQQDNDIDHILAISQLHQQQQRTDLTLALLDLALDTHPNNMQLLYRKAIVLETNAQPAQAQHILKQLVRDYPDNADYLNALGYSLMVSQPDQLTQAIVYVERAYSLDDSNPAIIDSLGWGYYLRGELNPARTYLEQAWALLKDAEIGAHLGEVLWQLGEKDNARTIWQQALARDANYPVLLDTIKRFAPELLLSKDDHEN